MDDQAVIDAVGRINRKLQAAKGAGRAELQLPTPQEVCQTYKSIEPEVKALLPAIGLIPVYGGAITGALSLLMNIADSLCPV